MKIAADPVAVAGQLKKITRLRPTLAFILGSGFQGTGAAVRATTEVDYSELPGFSIPAVAGHVGKLSVGYLGPAPVIVLNGRTHYYEDHGMDAVTFPVRVLAACGVKDLILTNAAGGINPRCKAGDFMVATDHLNLMGTNPLIGGPFAPDRFVDLTYAHSERLVKLLKRAAAARKIPLRSGVFAAVSGPCYETPAEVRALARLGADAVGMSTVPEVIVARHCGMEVAVLSAITNPAANRKQKPLSHQEVLSAGRRMQARAAELLAQFSELYATERG